MAKILVIGDIFFESQYFVSKIPEVNTVSVAEISTNIIGSKTINAARVLAKLNDKVDFFGRTGTDEFAKLVAGYFKKFKINPLLKKVKDNKTGQLVVITDTNGQSSITINLGANKIFKDSDLKYLKERIAGYDIVYTTTHLPLNYLYELIRMCNKLEVMLFLDFPNQHTLLDLEKLKFVDFIVPNRQEAGLLLKTAINTLEDAFYAAKELRKNCLGNILITLDEDGCVFLRKDSVDPKHFRTVKLKPIDTTASGDIFRAVFVHQFLKTKDYEQSIVSALGIATDSITLRGVDNTINNLKFNI